jgi:dTDP-4-dehydrorhamnose 3,5-epimerase
MMDLSDTPPSQEPLDDGCAGTVVEGLLTRTLDLPDIRIFRAIEIKDARGSVASVYSRSYFESLGIRDNFVQENHCVSPKRGTIRGFHYQLPPYGQSKLVRVVRGRILDVNVDLRCGSPTFGRCVKAELSPDGWNQIYVPVGFAHCYATLTDNVEIVFKLGCGYAPDYAAGLAWNDPDLAIDWPFRPEEVIVVQRDLDRPKFSELARFFPFDTGA